MDKIMMTTTLRHLISTFRDGIDLVRNGASAFTTFSHSPQSLLYPFRGLSNPTATATLHTFRVNGYSIGRFLSLFNYQHLLNEISRWSVDVDLSSLWQGKIAQAFHYNRNPTLREIFEDFALLLSSLFSKSKSAVAYLLPIILKVGIGALFAGFVLLVWFAIAQLSRPKKYKPFAPPPVPINQRPNAVARRGGPGVIPLDFNAYPLENQASAEVLIEKVQVVDSKLNAPDHVLCPPCQMPLTQCACLAPNTGAIHQQMMADWIRERGLLAEQLRALMRRGQTSFYVGSNFKFPARGTYWLQLAHYLGLRFRVRWRIDSMFEVAETRPSVERHIGATNSRFLTLSQLEIVYDHHLLWFCLKGRLDRKWLSLLGIPTRDLVVSEDHLRLTRRGGLDESFAASLRSQLQTSMAVPINDPTFFTQQVNPLRDAYLVVRAMKAGFIPAWEDF